MASPALVKALMYYASLKGDTLEMLAMPKKKTPKPTVKKAHKIARRIAKTGGVRNPWAVGMAQAKKSARKRKAKRSK